MTPLSQSCFHSFASAMRSLCSQIWPPRNLLCDSTRNGHPRHLTLTVFLRKQKGSIVTVSSMWGQVGASCEAAYSATKGAVIALTKALAKELGPSGVRANCVAPGVIATDMCAGIDPQSLEDLRQDTPVGRLGTAEDVAGAIGYLAEANFITGEVLSVNGGYVI